MSRRDYSSIEYMLRQGRKTIDTWESAAVKDCWVTKEMKEWSAQQPKAQIFKRLASSLFSKRPNFSHSFVPVE